MATIGGAWRDNRSAVISKSAWRVSSTWITAAPSTPCGGRSQRIPVAPRSTACGMKTWPSCCSPRRATNRPPGLTSLESIKSWLKLTSGGPPSKWPRVASTTSFTDIPTASLFSLSRRDLPLGDQRTGDRLPDGGRDVGPFEEDLGLARDHQHDELRVIGGHETNEGTDRLVLGVAAVLGDTGGAGFAGDPVLETVDTRRKS